MLELFFPKRYKNKFIIKNTFLVIYLDGHSISCILVEMSGEKRVISKYSKSKIMIENTQNDTFEDLCGKQILKMVDGWAYNGVKFIITSKQFMFKFLDLPFFDEEKVKMVAPFEIEPSLPFSLSECVIDSISFNKKKDGNFQVISAVTKQENISDLKDISKIAGLKIDSISLDVIEIISYCFNLIRDLTSYAIIICNESSYFCVVIMEGIILGIRTLDVDFLDVGAQKEENKKDEKYHSKDFCRIDENKKAEKTLVKDSTEKTTSKNNIDDGQEKKDSEKTGEGLIEVKNQTLIKKLNGEENESYINKKQSSEDLKKIKFKVDEKKNDDTGKEIEDADIIIKKKDIIRNEDFINNENIKFEDLKNVFLNFLKSVFKSCDFSVEKANLFVIGKSSKGEEFLYASSKLKCEIKNFYYDKNGEVRLAYADEKIKNDLEENDIMIISAYMFQDAEKFNLAHEEDSENKKSFINRILIVSSLLVVLILFILLFWNVAKIQIINRKLKNAENEVVFFLKKEFDLSSKFTSSVEKSIKESSNIVSILESNLPSLAIEKKYNFINIFEKLSSAIPQDIKNLEIKEIRWKKKVSEKSTFFFSGSVKDFDSLKKLESSLRESKIFVQVPQAQDINFSFDLICNNAVEDL
jgi:hypothetical protein